MCQIGRPLSTLTLTRESGRIAYRAFCTRHATVGSLKRRVHLTPVFINARPFRRQGNRSHRPPLMRDYHGFWSYHPDYYQDLVRRHTYRVLAKVRVWGKVVRHTKGYRSSRLDILGLTKEDMGIERAYRLPLVPVPRRKRG